jgi:hypothetical protein
MKPTKTRFFIVDSKTLNFAALTYPQNGKPLERFVSDWIEDNISTAVDIAALSLTETLALILYSDNGIQHELTVKSC